MIYEVKTNNPFLANMERYNGITTTDAEKVAEYVVENGGSELSDDYDNMLDECYGDIEICGYTYSASVALYRVDEVAYSCGKSDFESSKISDIEYEVDMMEDGEEVVYYGYTVTATEENEENEN